MAFSGFYGVPERCSVTEALRSMSGQQNFRMENAALACVVADFVVIFAVQAFACAICCGSKDALSRASLDLRNGEMIATFILPEFVNYVFFFLRNLLYIIPLYQCLPNVSRELLRFACRYSIIEPPFDVLQGCFFDV